MMLAIKAGMAEMEREKIVDRTMGGKRAKVRSGRPLGCGEPPFGLMFSADKSRYVEDPTEIAWLRWMFERADAGQSFRSIAKELQDNGVLPPYHHRTGSTVWGQPTVMRILSNEKYLGTASAFETEWVPLPGLTKNGKPRKRLVTLAADDPRRIQLPDGVYPPVIDPARFARVQERAAANRRETQRKDRDPREGLFRRGFAVCGVCGNNLVVRKRHKAHQGFSYSCGGATRWSCGKTSIMTHLLDGRAWALIEGVLNRPEAIEERLAQLRREDATGPELEVVDRLLERIGQDQAKVARAIRLLDDEDAAAPLLAELANLAKQRKGVEAERDEIAARRQGLEDDRRRLREAIDYTREVRRQVAAENAALDWDAKRTVLQRFRVRVVLFPANHTPRWGIRMRWEDRDGSGGAAPKIRDAVVGGGDTPDGVARAFSELSLGLVRADGVDFERWLNDPGYREAVEANRSTASVSNLHSSSVVR